MDDDAPKSSPAQASSTSYIGESKAKELALKHAGISADKISNYKIELDRDDGTAVYEIEFQSGRTEYELSLIHI